jgi:hypothetical protein
MVDFPPPEAPVPRVRALVYDTGSGRIEMVLTNIPLDMAELQAGDGQAVLVTDEGDGGTLCYCPDGVLTERPTMAFDRTTIAADGEDTATLAIPGRFTVTVDGVEHEVEDEVEIASAMPATYRVTVDHFPWLPIDVEIVAA